MTTADLLDADLLTKNPLLPTLEAIKLAAPYLNPSAASVSRWINDGVPAADGGRVKLPAVRVGLRLYTSIAAVRWFVDKQQESEIDAALMGVFGQE